MLENVATETSQVSRPGRTAVQKILLAIGPLTMLAALLVIVWPTAPSDCHGSPVCALDGLAALGKLFFGALLGLGGLAWTCLVGAATAVHQGVKASTPRVR